MLRPLVLLAVAVVFPAPTVGQWLALVSGDATVAPRLVWRGITRIEGPILQPDLYGTLVVPTIRLANLTITAPSLSVGSLWTLPLDNEQPDRLTTGTEFNPWIQVGFGLGRLFLSAGWTQYRYELAPNTWEWFTRAQLDFEHAMFRLSGWFDRDQVDGNYWETAVTLRLPWQPIPLPQFALDPVFGVVDLDIVLGWNSGQSRTIAVTEGFYFEKKGLTHMQVGLGTGLLVRRRVYIEPRVYLQSAIDDAAKIISASPLRTRTVTVWLALTVSLSSLLSASTR